MLHQRQVKIGMGCNWEREVETRRKMIHVLVVGMCCVRVKVVERGVCVQVMKVGYILPGDWSEDGLCSGDESGLCPDGDGLCSGDESGLCKRHKVDLGIGALASRRYSTIIRSNRAVPFAL